MESALIRSETSDWQKIALLYRSTGAKLGGKTARAVGKPILGNRERKDNGDERNTKRVLNQNFSIAGLLHSLRRDGYL